MRPSRLRTGEWLAAVGSIVLLVSLLAMHWYDGTPLRTGWGTMGTLRWFVLVTVVLGLGLAVAQGACTGPALPVTLDLLGMLVAGLTTILVLVRLGIWGAPLCVGAVVGALASVAVTCGAFSAMRAEDGWSVTPDRPVAVVGLDGPGDLD